MIDTPVTIEVVDADKAYRRTADTVHAVRSVSFRIEPGRITVLAGPSGSGKTTLLNLILGWESLDSGRIDGVPSTPTWSDLAVVPQSVGLLPHLTIRENVALPDRVNRPRYRAEDLMKALAIAQLARRFPEETSLGEQQRTAIARALVSGPRLLILDEPSSHQDADNTERIVDSLTTAAADGTTVLVATHDERIISTGDHHLNMHDGRVETVRSH